MRWLVLALALGACDDGGNDKLDLATPDLWQGMPICPPGVDSSQVPCSATDTHCYTVGGA